MKKIEQLKNRLSSQVNFKNKYDLEDDDKVHLLYVSPKLNATGYYRMIVQAMEINNSKTHKAIVTNIEVNNFNNSLNDLTVVLDERLIIWADYIIFPSVFSDITYLIKAIKEINHLVQIAFTVDQNYFALNQKSDGVKKVTSTNIENLEGNLAKADLLLVSNPGFKNYLGRYINYHYPETNAMTQYIPNLISTIGYESVKAAPKNENEKFRVGLIKPSFEDLSFLKKLINQMDKTLLNKLQFVCIGRSTTKGIIEKLGLKNVFEFHNTVSFSNYFIKLQSLHFDTALLLASESTFNKHSSSYSFLELSAFSIPTIVSIYHSASIFIEDGKNGLLAATEPEYLKALDLLVNIEGIKEEIGNNALKIVWKYHSFTSDQIKRISEEIFF